MKLPRRFISKQLGYINLAVRKILFANYNKDTTNPYFVLPLQDSLNPERANGSSVFSFTRASTAYQIDFEGKHNAVLSGEARIQGARRVRNLIVGSSEVLTNGSWFNNGANATATTVTFDSGTASRLTQAGVFIAGHTYRLSATLQGTQVTTISMRFYDGAQFVNEQIAVGLTPVRVSIIGTASSTFTGGDGAQFRNNAAGNAAGTITITKIHLEDVTGQSNQAPGDYVSVGVLSAPFHGAGVDGVKYFSTLNGNTVASNVVTEATGAAINSAAAACAGGVTAGVVDANGPLGEIDSQSLQNVLGTTAAIVRTMADAGWVATNVTKGSATGTDGVASAAASLTATAGNGTALYTTVLGAAVRTYSPWVRRKTGTGTVNMTVDNGSTWTPITLTTTYQRFPLTTANAANPVVGFQIVTSADAIEVDWNVLVAGSIPAPNPIPLNVTTAADVSQYVSAGNISSTAASIVVNVTPTATFGTFTGFIWASYVDASNYTAILFDGTNLIARKRISGANHDATIAWTPTVNTLARVGARFDTVTGSDIWLNGTKGTNDATTTASQIGTNFQVGADGNGANQDFCEHRLFEAYPVGLSDSKMAQVTSS